MRRSRPGDSHRNGTRAKGEGWGCEEMLPETFFHWNRWNLWMGVEDLWGQRVGSPLQMQLDLKFPPCLFQPQKMRRTNIWMDNNCVSRGVTIIPPHLIVNLQILYEVLVRSNYHPLKI